VKNDKNTHLKISYIWNNVYCYYQQEWTFMSDHKAMCSVCIVSGYRNDWQ